MNVSLILASGRGLSCRAQVLPELGSRVQSRRRVRRREAFDSWKDAVVMDVRESEYIFPVDSDNDDLSALPLKYPSCPLSSCHLVSFSSPHPCISHGSLSLSLTHLPPHHHLVRISRTPLLTLLERALYASPHLYPLVNTVSPASMQARGRIRLPYRIKEAAMHA